MYIYIYIYILYIYNYIMMLTIYLKKLVRMTCSEARDIIGATNIPSDKIKVYHIYIY